MWIFVFPSPDLGKEKLRSRWKWLLGLPPSLGIRNTAKRQAESPQAEARRFSKQNWRNFLACGPRGLGMVTVPGRSGPSPFAARTGGREPAREAATGRKLVTARAEHTKGGCH